MKFDKILQSTNMYYHSMR